jgi:hypothetical protein
MNGPATRPRVHTIEVGGSAMARHDVTSDGHKPGVDPKNISKPKDDGGKHSGDNKSGGKGDNGGKK